MKSICSYTCKCDKRQQHECSYYIDEPIPVHHLGGMMPFLAKGNPIYQQGYLGIPRLGYGCCEYIYQRDRASGREHEIGEHIQNIHNLKEAIPIVKEWEIWN